MKPGCGGWVRGAWKRPQLEVVTSPHALPMSVYVWARRNQVAWGLGHPFPPILSFPLRLGPPLLFPEVFPNPSQKRKLFWGGQGRDEGNEQLSCSVAGELSKFSGQALSITVFQEGTSWEGWEETRRVDQGARLWFCLGSWAHQHPFCSFCLLSGIIPYLILGFGNTKLASIGCPK